MTTSCSGGRDVWDAPGLLKVARRSFETRGRSCVATGERDAAFRVLRELLDRSPGYDGAHELLLELTSNAAIAELDKL